MKRFEVPVYFDVDADSIEEAWEKMQETLSADLLKHDNSIWHSWLIEEPTEYFPEDM